MVQVMKICGEVQVAIKSTELTLIIFLLSISMMQKRKKKVRGLETYK